MTNEHPESTIFKRDIHKVLILIARDMSTRSIYLNQSLLASGTYIRDIDTSHLIRDECEDDNHRKPQGSSVNGSSGSAGIEEEEKQGGGQDLFW